MASTRPKYVGGQTRAMGFPVTIVFIKHVIKISRYTRVYCMLNAEKRNTILGLEHFLTLHDKKVHHPHGNAVHAMCMQG